MALGDVTGRALCVPSPRVIFVAQMWIPVYKYTFKKSSKNYCTMSEENHIHILWNTLNNIHVHVHAHTHSFTYVCV